MKEQVTYRLIDKVGLLNYEANNQILLDKFGREDKLFTGYLRTTGSLVIGEWYSNEYFTEEELESFFEKVDVLTDTSPNLSDVHPDGVKETLWYVYSSP